MATNAKADKTIFELLDSDPNRTIVNLLRWLTRNNKIDDVKLVNLSADCTHAFCLTEDFTSDMWTIKFTIQK